MTARTVHTVAWCVGGRPGSGKSVFGRALARASGAVLLDQDVVTNPLMAEVSRLAGSGDDLDAPDLRGDVRRARYRCLFDAAAENLGLGHSCVLVAPYTVEAGDAESWSYVQRLLLPAHAVLCWVTVPRSVAVARRHTRDLPRDRGAANLEPLSPVVEHLLVDGTVDPESEAARVQASSPEHFVGRTSAGGKGTKR